MALDLSPENSRSPSRSHAFPRAAALIGDNTGQIPAWAGYSGDEIRLLRENHAIS